MKIYEVTKNDIINKLIFELLSHDYELNNESVIELLKSDSDLNYLITKFEVSENDIKKAFDKLNKNL